MAVREIELLGLHEIAGAPDQGRPGVRRPDGRRACDGGRPDGGGPLAPALVAPTALEGGWWVDRPTWHARAACRGVGPAQFFPPRGNPVRRVRSAVAVCERCGVAWECLSYGLDNDCVGVWGGLVLSDHTR
jgi:hypothetical protein